MADYPWGEALIPERFDEHTVLWLVRAPDAPELSEEALDALQVEHLTYLRELKRRGVLIANGPLTEQTDVRMRPFPEGSSGHQEISVGVS